MVSTPTPLLRLEMQGTGDNVNTWGIRLNSSTIALIDSAIAGRTTIENPTSGQTLSSVNYSTDQSRQPVLHFSGTVSGDVSVNVGATAKFYLTRDTTTGGNLLFQTAGGTGVTLPKSGYATVAVTAAGVEDARAYELNPTHIPTNPGGIVTRTSLGVTLSSVGMPGGYTPISNSGVTTKAYVDSQILAAMLSGTLPGQSGNAGKFLQTDGTNPLWAAVTLPTSGITWVYTSTSGTASSFQGYVVDTSALPITILLSGNGPFYFTDAEGTFNGSGLTISGGTAKVMGFTGSMLVNTQYAAFGMVRNSGANDYRFA